VNCSDGATGAVVHTVSSEGAPALLLLPIKAAPAGGAAGTVRSLLGALLQGALRAYGSGADATALTEEFTQARG
jgi:hypothetical protein